MEVKDTLKYVTTGPKKAIKATTQLVQNGAQKISNLPKDVHEWADKGLSQIIKQNKDLKNFSLRSGKNGNSGRVVARPTRDPIGTPAQTGSISQRTEAAKNYTNEAKAKEAFRTQSEALLRPGGWNDNSLGLTHADAPSWHLLNPNGKEERSNRRVQKGDVLRIDAPGPDFFVKAERVHVGAENAQFTVVPCADPNAKNGAKTAHFFTDGSSRTFTLQRDGKEVRFVTEGNNERANVGSQSGGWKAPWNAASSAVITAGGGEVYWNSFAKGLMRK